MKTKKVILSIVLSIIMVLMLVGNVNAVSDATGTVTLIETTTPEGGKYKVGDTLSIEVRLAVTGVEGVNEFKSNAFEYDGELLQYTGATPTSGWRIESSASNVFYTTRNQLDNAKGLIATLNFKVLKQFESTEIKLGEFDLSDTNMTSIFWDDDNISDTSINIKSGIDTEPTTPENPDDPNTPENPDEPNNPDDPNTPENPDDPNTPENPDDPNTPENPDEPNNPDDPNKPGNPDDSNTPGNSSGNNSGNNNDNGNKDVNGNNSSTNKDGRVPASRIPQTGQIGITILVIGLVVSAIAFIVLRKMKDVK